jgi:glutamate racemase
MLAEGIDTLVLGCTHYPLLKQAIRRICGPDVALVDSAENCAFAVMELLKSNPSEDTTDSFSSESAPRLDILLTDSSEGFLRIAEKSLGLSIDSLAVRRIGN